ncbi:hypothetical protein [Pantanalinema sp. GBBB05]|uniref:hypothetical protein n=1 Tax=Pantanalinema sp. GBBB05 TaxID=2604139 RepID=UPI001D5B1716|nr:hypothetical protein [Pantanalinema sp. GBBB05]
MKYPAWIPYPICWVKALQSSIPAFAGGGIVFMLGLGKLGHLSAMFAVYRDERLGAVIAFTVFAAALSLLWYFILLFVYSAILQLLWSRPPAWLTAKSSLGIAKGWLIGLLATLPAFLIVFQRIPPMSELEDMSDDTFKYLFIAWWVVAAYLYQFTFLIGRRWQKPKVTSSVQS